MLTQHKLLISVMRHLYSIVLLAGCLSMPVQASSSAQYVYHVSTQGYFPPYHWYDAENHKPQGYTHKIIDLLSEQLGFGLQIKNVDLPFQEITTLSLEALVNQQADFAFSPLATAADDKHMVVVKEPIHTATTRVFFLKSKAINHRQWDDLKPYTGGYLSAYMFTDDLTFDRYVEQSLPTKRYPSYQQMVKALINEEVDYLLGMSRPTWFELQILGKRGAVTTADELTTQLDVYMLISKHSPLASQAEEIAKLLKVYKNNGLMSSLVNEAIQEHASYRKAVAKKGQAQQPAP